MLRKDYFKYCSCLTIGYIISYIVAPIICVWTTYTYLNVSMVKDPDYYARICFWVIVIAILVLIEHVLFTYTKKVYYSRYYGIISTIPCRGDLDAIADKLKLTDKERKLFKKRSYRAAKLRKFFMNNFLDNLGACLGYSGIMFLGAVVLFVFLYLLTSLPMMLSIALELIKLGIAVLLIFACWGY